VRGTNSEFGRFLGYAYRSLKEIVTCLELCQRLYPGVHREATVALADEGNQISRMTYNRIQRLSKPKTQYPCLHFPRARRSLRRC
jgi:four helix bundle protein